MKFSTIYYFITSVPSQDIPASFWEEVSLLTFPEVSKYIESEETKVRDSLVDEIIAKSKA
jgi:hypothetical protein